jgi:MFS transporter, DHA1 family, multidrug resistance protein
MPGQGRMSADASPDVAAPVMSEARVALLGGLFVAIGPVSMALYTPAMTEIVHAFGTTESLVKLTLTLYFGGFAFAQLIAGPLSDALGRRPVTFVFMAIYCAASLVALVAPGIEMLMAARFVQGVGASAGVAISRAIVRDLFTGERSSRIMNLIGIILAIGPATAPTIGGLTLEVAGWRAIFAIMAVFGVVVVVATALALRETVVADRSRFRARALFSSYGLILRNREFLAAAGVISGSIGALYAQATFLPFILMGRVGLSATEFGLGMLMQSGSFLAGSLLVRALMNKTGPRSIMAIGISLIGAGSVGVACLLFWEPSFLRVMGPVGIYAAGIAFVMPAMSTAALRPFALHAGAAAAMLGFLQMGSGLFAGTLGATFGDPLLAMASIIPAMGVLAILSYLGHLRGERRAMRAGAPGAAEDGAA